MLQIQNFLLFYHKTKLNSGSLKDFLIAFFFNFLYFLVQFRFCFCQEWEKWWQKNVIKYEFLFFIVRSWVFLVCFAPSTVKIFVIIIGLSNLDWNSFVSLCCPFFLHYNAIPVGLPAFCVCFWETFILMTCWLGLRYWNLRLLLFGNIARTLGLGFSWLGY